MAMTDNTKGPLNEKLTLNQERSVEFVTSEKFENFEAQAQHSITTVPQTNDIALGQSNLICIILTSCFVSMFAMADQTAISIILPFIAEDLDAHTTIQWAGVGALISSTIFNIIAGRFADLFGRRKMIIISLFIIGTFELAAVFSWDKTSFYIFRSLTGLGNGGIVSLAMVIISDNLIDQQKATVQGILGLSIGIGSCIGPFISSTFVSHSHSQSGWKQYFFFMGCIFILAGFMSIITLSKIKENKQQQPEGVLRSIDYYGLVLSSLTVILLLLPLNMGGINWKWGDLKVILCGIFAFLSFLLLILAEHSNQKTALIPLKFFKNFKVSNFILQTLLVSIVYSSMIYHLPNYFISVHELDVSKLPIILLAMLIPIAIGSLVSGPMISYFNRFKYVIVIGYIFLLISLVMIISGPKAHSSFSLSYSIITLVLMGIGFGFIFTPLTTGIQSQVTKNEVSVLLSTKAVLKNFGNSLGVALSYVIYSNELTNDMNKLQLNEQNKTFLMKSLGKKVNLSYTFSGNELTALENIFATSLKSVFIVWIPVTLVCLILSLFLENKGVENIAEEGDQQKLQD